MSSTAALSEASPSRVLVLGGDQPRDVFDVLGISDGIARVRSPYLFEIGEELPVRIEHDGRAYQATARVRGHVGPLDARITELELSDDPALDPGLDPGPDPAPAAAGPED